MIKNLFYAVFAVLLTFGVNMKASGNDVVKTVMLNDNELSLPENAGNIYAVKNGTVNIPVVIKNNGMTAVSDVDVTCVLGGEKRSMKVTPVKQMIGNDVYYSFNISMPTPQNTGDYDYSISVDKINGVENTSVNNASHGKFIAMSRKVAHKVVFEEFTGLGCGWCPRGIVAATKAKQKYGDNIVIASVHDDHLRCKAYNRVLHDVMQKPSAHLDRTLMGIDPYFGSMVEEEVHFGIANDIDKMAAIEPVAEVNVSASLDGDILTAKSDVRFLYSGKANHAVAFVVTADGLHNEKWKQSNNYFNYKGQGLEDIEPLFDMWVNGESTVTNVIYDDVVMAAKGVDNGIEGSIPEEVTEEEPNVYEETFNLSKMKYLQDKNKVNVCVFLFDTTTGHIVNAGHVSLGSAAGIDGVKVDSEDAVETARYTIDGRRISVPEKGINIVKYSDGTVKKMIVE